MEKQSDRVVRAPERMTLTVAQYAKLAGVGQAVVRMEIAAGRLPHRKYGKRGLIRILRGPALAELGFDARKALEPDEGATA
ncbi:MAG TPA: hypothetical protein VHR97_07055 [Candidatus Baltobacteraceae bacterium]|nr:hypothetical protein [Candidatus Baltobacteraceae bacterium]